MNNNIINKFEFPIVDNHIHINIETGSGINAIKCFEKYGGTHIFLVSLPSWSYNLKISKKEDFNILFQKTLKTANLIENNTNIKVFPILGVHPVELLNMSNKLEIKKKIELMNDGLKITKKYIKENKAFGIKSGRIHFDTTNELENASNKILEQSLLLAKELDCTIQLHEKNMTIENIDYIGKLIKKINLKKNKIINHHALPYIKECESKNIFPSITAKFELIEQSINNGSNFILETDYFDDFRRPGAVLSTKTIPKNINKLLLKNKNYTEIFWKINKDNIEKIYNNITIDI